MATTGRANNRPGGTRKERLLFAMSTSGARQNLVCLVGSLVDGDLGRLAFDVDRIERLSDNAGDLSPARMGRQWTALIDELQVGTDPWIGFHILRVGERLQAGHILID